LVGVEGEPSRSGEIHVPPVSYETALKWISAADVIATPQRATRVGRAQSPAKIVDAMAVGRTIVASRLGPIEELVGDTAILVEPGSADAMAVGLGSALEDRGRRGLNVERTRVSSTLSALPPPDRA
jgi:glycosyltransferase involved in cell wall biosynthesis